jgi:hypothetical protein
MRFSCFNTTSCEDLILIALDIQDRIVNYVDIETIINIKNTISKRPVFIVGYPHDTLNIKKSI